MNKTIFRVVGGNSRRSVLNEYEIIPYEVIKETPRYYTTIRDGKQELQQKRTTSNSEWFEDIEGSLRAVLIKLNKAIASIQETISKVIATEFARFPVCRYVYVCRFAYEIFTLERFAFEHYSYNVKGKGWRIENVKTRIAKKKLDTGFLKEVTTTSGRCYVYEHKSEPHNAKRPIERWVGVNLELIQKLAEQYATDRIKYLERCKQKQTDWVRQWERMYDEQTV
jgi:hypothetical protein